MKYTNAQMSKRGSFIKACEEAKIRCTSRQVSKLRNHHGALWNYLQTKRRNWKMERKNIN